MTNIKDWCISRQLWWGHRIPAYFLPDGSYVVAESDEEALALAIEKSGNKALTLADLKRDEDCLDTWFSSWLWPISLFNGILDPDNKEFKYYYPTTDLVTGPDIIFFWVARMIVAGYEFAGNKPFNNVYFTGIVRDKIGRKMSKSLGNSPDPLDLIDKFGADGVRMGLMLAAPAGHDIMYDDSLCEQGRNFCNKIWNAYRLVNGWNVDASIPQPEYARLGVEWFDAKLAEVMAEVEDLMSKFRISEALMALYKLFWDEFSSWYLEIVKPQYGSPIDKVTYDATLRFFDLLLKLLHPFMPFITEELWQQMDARSEGESIMTQQLPSSIALNKSLTGSFDTLKEIIAGVRTIRLQKQIPNKNELELKVNGAFDNSLLPVLLKMAHLKNMEYVEEKDPTAVAFRVGATEFSVPLGDNVNVEEELKKLNADLKYYEGFLAGVLKKLSNERFVANAPEKVVALERKKQSDAEEKIAAIKASLQALSGK
jgi:valyl-tRNA synthetase